MSFCLPKFAASEMLKSLKDGTINPEKLSDMTSKDRRDFFKGIVGEENATNVNSLFESKLLLKNQQQGMITWAKELTGIKPEIKRDILTRVGKMTEILEPKQLDLFMEDLAAKRLGVSVTANEAAEIARLSSEIDRTKDGEDRVVYGRAKVAFYNYINDLKEDAEKLTVKERLQPKNYTRQMVEGAGIAKSLKASLDNSAIFRQGWKVMFTDSKEWFANAKKTFSDIQRTLGGEKVMDELMADILSRPTYDKMVKAKLAVGNIEEAYPSSLPEKVPGFGRLYKASETAYTGFIYKTRADVFDKYLEIAKQTGIDVTDKDQLLSIGRLVNALTGRSNLGAFEPAANAFNNIFFSPRFAVSHFEFLTAHTFNDMTPFAKKMAIKNLAKYVAGVAVILGIANAVKSGSVELDPRSSDFGKIKIGSSRFDVTGGAASVATLAARILTLSSKSTSTGQVNPLNSGKFRAATGMDVLVNFLENKASPVASVFRDYFKGKDANGNKPTLVNEAGNLLLPLPISNMLQNVNDPNSANLLASIIADGLGISVNSYGGSAQLIADDKENVLQEVLTKVAEGDSVGAMALAKDFNDKLKESIKEEVVKSDPQIDPNDLAKKVDTKFNKESLHVPTKQQATDFKSGNKDVVQKILANGKPVIVQNSPTPAQGVIGVVLTYAHAVGVDPVTAFHDIFTGQRIKEVTNGTIIVQRMAFKDSEAVKKARNGDTISMKLDHTIPLELGGDNSEDNLKIVPTATWKSYSPVENYLGKALREGKADKKTVQSLIARFKNGEITFEDIKKQI